MCKMNGVKFNIKGGLRLGRLTDKEGDLENVRKGELVCRGKVKQGAQVRGKNQEPA